MSGWDRDGWGRDRGRDGRDQQQEEEAPSHPLSRLHENPRVALAMYRKLVQRRAKGRADAQAAAAAKIPTEGGAALPGETRERMEGQLGADLSGVRVHTGGDAARAAEARGAHALTVGNEVHFASGAFAPGSKEGDRLLAHELTHVVQGQRSGVQRKAEEEGADAEGAPGEKVSQPGEPAEQEADSVADGVADNLHGGDEEGEGEEKADPEEIEAAKAQLGGDEEHGNTETQNGGAEVKQAAPAIGAKLDPTAVHAALKLNGKPKPGATVTSPPGKTGTGKTADSAALPVKVRQQQDAQKKNEKNVPMPPDQKRPAAVLTTAQEKDVKARIAAGDRNITKAEIEALNRSPRVAKKRERGVDNFWSMERERLRAGMPPTRNWTPEQKETILRGETPKGPDGKPMEGHHMFGVKDYPQAAGTGKNIYPATDKEHNDRWHGGDTKADTDGKPRNPKHPEEF